MLQTGCWSQAWTGTRGQKTSICWNLVSVTLLCHNVESGEERAAKWTIFCHTQLSLPHDFIHLSENHLCSLAGPFSPICSSYFSLSLDVIFISFYLSDRVFIFALSLRISFIPKSHFCTLHSKSVLLEMCSIMMYLRLIHRLKTTYSRDGKTEFSVCYVHCFLSVLLCQQPCYPLLPRPMEVKP